MLHSSFLFLPLPATVEITFFVLFPPHADFLLPFLLAYYIPAPIRPHPFPPNLVHNNAPINVKCQGGGGGGGVAGLPSGNLTFLGKPESNSLLRISAPRKRFSLEVKQLGAPCMFKVPT